VADIVDLVRADHVRARQLFAVLRRRPRDRAAVAGMWAELAELLEAHVAAVEEICCVELMRHDPYAAASAEAQADRDDVLEAVGEARLCPAGSLQWQRVVAAAQRASTAYFRRLDRGMTVLGDSLDPDARRELACQWRAFRHAWSLDRGTRPAAEPWASRQFHEAESGRL
jgi:Hemerythrin HHE cation binding domain